MTGGLVGLRIVENHERRADRFSVRPFELHAADAPGQTSDLDDRAAGVAVVYRWQHDLFRCPADLRAFALKELAVGSVGDSVESLDGKTDFGIVGQQQIVAVEFGLDRIEHVAGVTFVATDQTNEITIAVENRPDAGDLGDRTLATASRHCQREQPALGHGLLDLRDDFQVIRRPSQVER